MRKLTQILLLLAMSFVVQNCASFLGGVNGSIYTDVVGTATVVNKDMSAKEGLGSKTGESCATGYLGLVATGDAGIKAAAKAGGINNVRALDIRQNSILGSLFVKQCAIVHGD